MDPTRDNPLIRIKAFLDGLGIFTLFAVLLLLILGAGALFGWFQKGEEPEDATGKIRYEISREVQAEQKAFLSENDINEAMAEVAGSLAASKPLASDQVVPGSPTAGEIAGKPMAKTDEIDAAGDANEPIDPAQMEIGKTQYLVCGACHGQNGEGSAAGPPLAGSEWVTGPVSNLILIQLRGLKGPIEVAGKTYEFPAGMTPMSYQTDEQIAGVLTYIRNSFGNKATAVKPEQVAELRSEVGKPQINVSELIKP